MKMQDKRKEKGLTQKQLAELSGLDIRKIQTYESGARSFSGARLDTILRIALALECRIEDILDDPDLVQLLMRYADLTH